MNRKNTMVTLTLAVMMFTSTLTPIHAEGTIGWVENNGVWSYVQEDGTKAIGWLKDGDCWYYLNEDGSMKTGWIASNEHWYYLGLSGVMQKDYKIEENGFIYYVKENGVMAKEYVKDGIEYDKEGIGRSVSETNSVVIRNAQDLEGLTSVEGNLYVTEAVAEDLELSGIEIKGTLVIQATDRTVSLKDTHVETVSIQGRESKVVLNGTSDVNKVVLERGATLEAAKGYQGNVANVEIQSSVTEPSVIDLKADEVGIRAYSEVTVNAPIKAVTVSTDTTVHVNADIETVVVQGTAAGTVVEVNKGSTIGTVVADAQTTLDGKGTVNKVEANVNGVEAGKDTVIKDVEAGKDVTEKPEVNSPSRGGGTARGGNSRPQGITRYVTNQEEFDNALADMSINKIVVSISFTYSGTLVIPEGRTVEITLPDNITLNLVDGTTAGKLTRAVSVEGNLTLNGSGTLCNQTAYYNVYVSDTGKFIVDGASIITTYSDTNELVKNCGKMEFKSGVIGEGNTSHYSLGIGVGENASLTMYGGTINSSWFGIATNGQESGQNITIKGGTINNSGEESNIFYLPKAENVTITGGVFNGYDGGLEMRQGNLVITGGTFKTEKYKEVSESSTWGNGQSGFIWAPIVLGKPNVGKGYDGDLSVSISGNVTIQAANEEANAIVIDTRYVKSHADNVVINITNTANYIGKVYVLMDDSLGEWTISETDNSYHYLYSYIEDTENTDTPSEDQNTGSNPDIEQTPDTETDQGENNQTNIPTTEPSDNNTEHEDNSSINGNGSETIETE